MSEPRPRVLVIDDEPQVGRMLVRLLRRTHDVVAVTSADDALAVVEEGWDAILCDIMMPGADGPAFYVQLEERYPEVAPLVGFMTGGAFDARVQAFLETRGDEGWLAKPFQRADVIEFLDRLLHRADR